jgi:ClpX C4-type zinc finger protein
MEQPSSMPPPIITVNDRVLLHYAILNDSVGYNSGHGLMFVDGKEIGRVPCLAICQDKNSPQFMLYYCDSDWSLIGIASYDTVAAAKRRAERIYPGSFACWIEAKFTDDDAKRYLDEQFSDLQCSFCGKRPNETDSPFFEGNGNARICADCIRRFNS